MPSSVPIINVTGAPSEHEAGDVTASSPFIPTSQTRATESAVDRLRPTDGALPSQSDNPSDPLTLLRVPSSPGSIATSTVASSEGPQTPGVDSDSQSMSVELVAPPSPMEAAYLAHNTTKLRENDPNATRGKGSLDLLTPKQPRNHARQLSWSSNDGSAVDTEPDHGPQTPMSPTTHGDTPSPGVENTDKEEGAMVRPQLDPSKDTTDPAPFAFPPTHLASSLDPKNLEQLDTWGGTAAILDGLMTDAVRGLSTRNTAASDSLGTAPEKGGTLSQSTAGGDLSMDGTIEKRLVGGQATFEQRRTVYGANVLPVRKSKSLLLLMWLALKDRVLVILIIAAAVSLALGLYQDFGAPRERVACADGSDNCFAPQVDWVEGVAILIAVSIVVIVGSVNDWQKERQFKVLNAKKDDRGVKVIRDGSESIINVKDILVGDIALLEPGEIVPVDGIFLTGHNVRCDESGATGESDAVRKASFEDCWTEHSAVLAARLRGEVVSDTKKDPFIISGSKVMEGVGSYVVIALGERSFNGRIMMGLRGDSPNTPLQTKLNALAELIAKLGSLAGLILFSALMIRFFVQLGQDANRTANEKAMSFVQILIISVTLIVVAVPEGLPLAVTLALAFATKRMTRENLLVRVLGSCETMANATVVCTDKTGTLTQNVMSVVAGAAGIHCKFVRAIDQNDARSPLNKKESAERKYKQDFAIDMKDLNTALSPAARKLFNDAICINSTAFEDSDPDSGEVIFVGSKTETALLRFAKELGWDDYRKTREGATVVQMIPFSSERKAMGVVVQIAPNRWRLFLKGASEILTKECSSHIVVNEGAGSPASSTHKLINDAEVIKTNAIDDTGKENIQRTIIFYANQMLRTIAICYRDFESWPPVQNAIAEDEVPYSYLAQDLTLIGITGIEDPLRDGVREAVRQCQKAGVAVKMCTGDNVLTARSIATQCGIYTPGGIIMEGPAFRLLNEHELSEIVPRLQVLARSSPEDKKILVATLKGRGEIVGVTGDGSNDSLALKEAHVGFSMGIAGTEVAKEASDIILMDDNFNSIVSAIMWGRCVNDAVKKFLQFQISVNITAVIITFVSAVASNSETSVLTAVQLLWINIIMDTFAALALATDPAHPSLLNRLPDRLTAPLFNVDMCKMIIGQSIYQITIILIFHFAGNKIFGYEGLGEFEQNKKTTELGTLIFNAFVFCQIFNSVNCRRLDNKLNIFEGILANRYFLVITLLEVGVQILIVFVGGSAFQVTKMNGRDWGISIALGAMAIPLGVLIRYIPNGASERFLIKFRILPDPNKLPIVSPQAEQWNEAAINLVRDNLTTFANIRGGRVRASSFVGHSRTARLHKAGVELPSLLTMIPTLVATSIGAGWTKQEGDLSDPANSDPSRSSAALMDGRIQIHPETDKNDPFYKKYGNSRNTQV